MPKLPKPLVRCDQGFLAHAALLSMGVSLVGQPKPFPRPLRSRSCHLGNPPGRRPDGRRSGSCQIGAGCDAALWPSSCRRIRRSSIAPSQSQRGVACRCRTANPRPQRTIRRTGYGWTHPRCPVRASRGIPRMGRLCRTLADWRSWIYAAAQRRARRAATGHGPAAMMAARASKQAGEVVYRSTHCAGANRLSWRTASVVSAEGGGLAGTRRSRRPGRRRYPSPGSPMPGRQHRMCSSSLVAAPALPRAAARS